MRSAPGVLSLLIALLSLPCAAPAQSTAFTYQGRLLAGGQPANGLYDLQFVLLDAPTNGNPVGPVLSNPAVPVANGLFTIALDFGSTAFNGSERWLTVGVRTNGTTAPYSLLLPNQPVAAIPYATFATAAATAGSANTLADGGASLTNITAASIIGTLPASILTGQITPSLLPLQLPNWAGLDPDWKQDALGYIPATNSFVGITSALGFAPATNDVAFTNTGTIYIDPNGDDATAVVGRPDRPWRTVTNGFAQITSGSTVIIRGTHVIPATPEAGFGFSTTANAAIANVTNVTLYGAGAILQFTGSGYGISIQNVTNFKLKDLTLVGDQSLSPNAGLFGAIGFGGDNTDVEISGCRFIHWLDHALTTVSGGIYRTRNLKVTHNYFEDIGNDYLPSLGFHDGTCVSCFMAGNTWITENYATNVLRFVEYENAGDTYTGQGSDVWILNNSVEHLRDWGVFLVGYGYVLNNVRIVGNTFNHDLASMAIGGAPSISISAGTNILVADNVIYNNDSLAWADKIAVIANSTNVIDAVTIERNKLFNCRSGFAINVAGGAWGTNVVRHAEIRNNYMANIDLGPQSGAVDTVFEGNVIASFNRGAYDGAFNLLNGPDGFSGYAGTATNAIIRNNKVLESLGEFPNYLEVRGPGPLEYVGFFDNANYAGIDAADLFNGPIKRLVLRHYDLGSPADLVDAAPGSIWINTLGGAGSTFFLKETYFDSSGWFAFNAPPPFPPPSTNAVAAMREPAPPAGPTAAEAADAVTTNEAPLAVDMDRPYSSYDLSGPASLLSLTNSSPSQIKRAVLYLNNSSTTDLPVTLHPQWRTEAGRHLVTLPSNSVLALTVVTYGGKSTNVTYTVLR